ncbi:MAG: acyloxyacyl hydrolase [Propylenella sp.]
MRVMRAALTIAFAGAAFASDAAAQQFSEREGLFGIFDEVRGGAVYPVQPNDDSGVTLSGQLYFKSFVPPMQNYWANALLRPRVHVGGNLATGDDPINQVYAGLTWHFPIYNSFFFEGSFGGTWHDGPLDSPGDGLDLGCHWLFRESIALGMDVNDNWRVLASVDHSSHAGLCDDGRAGNSGITHAGVYVGYRF